MKTYKFCITKPHIQGVVDVSHFVDVEAINENEALNLLKINCLMKGVSLNNAKIERVEE